MSIDLVILNPGAPGITYAKDHRGTQWQWLSLHGEAADSPMECPCGRSIYHGWRNEHGEERCGRCVELIDAFAHNQIHLLSQTPYANGFTVSREVSPFLVGRNPNESDFVPTYHPLLSRKHCKLEWDGKNWTVSDLQSLNGTKINSVRIGLRPVKLQAGDLVCLGTDQIKFMVVLDVEAA